MGGVVHPVPEYMEKDRIATLENPEPRQMLQRDPKDLQPSNKRRWWAWPLTLILLCAGGYGLYQSVNKQKAAGPGAGKSGKKGDRNVPVVAVAGRGAATATGDLLFSRAFAELAAAKSVEAVRELAVACSQLAAGELMQRADAYDTGVSVSRYLERCRCKTAVLFRAACVLGSLAGDGEGERLAVFGERIGLAFQLLDDVLDVAGPPERTGKPRGTDLLDGTVTLPLILARERDPALASLDLRTVRDPVAATAVCDSIAATGALADTRARGLAMVAQAKDGLAGLEYRRRAALELVADGVVDRYA